MNKNALKKILLLLVVAVLTVSMFLTAACSPEEEQKPQPPKEETNEAKPSFTNGNFSSVTLPDKDADDKLQPFAPKSWNGNGPSADQFKDDLPKTNETVAGVITLKNPTYDDSKSKWGNLPLFEKNKKNNADYDADDNVLMIYNKKPSFYSYTSATSFTINQNTDYILTIDVKTNDIAENDKATADLPKTPGAHVRLFGSSSLISEYVGIDTHGKWKTYTFYIQGAVNSNKSAYLLLGLGKGDKSTENTNEFLTSGYAFFDNVTLKAITSDSEDTYEKAVESEFVKKVSTQAPNAEFDFVSNKQPDLYSQKVGSTETVFGQVNTNEKYFNLNKEKLGLTENPLTADNKDGNVFMIKNKNPSYWGFSTKNKIGFARGTAYHISMWVKTVDVSSAGATLVLSIGDKPTADDIKIENIDTHGEWQRYSFYLYANQNTMSEFYFQFWLGTNAAEDHSSFTSGTAFFDKLSVDKLAIESEGDSDAAFNAAVDKADDDDSGKTIRNLTTDEDDNLVKNGYFSTTSALDGWNAQKDDGEENLYNGFNVSNVVAQIVDADESTTIGEKTLKASDIPYRVFGDKLLLVYSPDATQYKLAYDFNTITLQPYTAYRFSMWIKTVDVQKTAGVTVEIKSGDDILASYANLNTTAATDDLNGFKEVICYIYTDNGAHDLDFAVSFGSGTKWTSSTLFSGEAYVANVSLTETTYAEFDASSTSNDFNKKYNFNKSVSNSFTNGAFANYDFGKTEGLATGGTVDGNLSKNFGVPSGWTSIDAPANGYAGIVDVENSALLDNIAGKGLSTKSELENLFFKNPDNDFNLHEYCGGARALMIASPDETAKEFVSYGYKNSGSISLAADSYHEISVLVKTIGATKASVYLVADSAYDTETAFTNIDTTSSQYNGWEKYTFRVKVGASSVSVQLALYLGKNNRPADADEAAVAVGGLVFFDSVNKKAITKDEYEAEITDNHTNKVEFAIDSFGLDEDKKHTNSDYLTPSSSNWTGHDNILKDDTAEYNAGIVNIESYNFNILDDDDREVLQTTLKPHKGNNLLVIHNKTDGAYSFSSSSKTLMKGKFYRISVWAKTYNLPEGKSAYIKLSLPDKFDNDDENVFTVTNSDDYKQYTYYVSVDDAASINGTKIILGLGRVNGDAAEYTTGYAIFDDVEIATVTKDAFNAATATPSDNVKVFKDTPDEPVNPEKPADKDADKDKERISNFDWLLFSSLAFSAILIVILIVYFVKRYAPKRKARNTKTADEKEQEDKYNKLND